MIEEMARVPAVSLAAGFATQTDIVLPYLFDFATPEQCKRWLPKMTTSEYIGAIAMTEPGTRVVTHTAEAAVTAPAGSWRSGDDTVRSLAVQDALADQAGPGADR